MERTLTLLFVVLLACSPALAEEAPADEAASQGEAPAEDDVDVLIGQLGAYDVQTRIDAAQALAERGDPSAVPALVNSLRSDPNAHVRGWTVRALHQLGTPEAQAAVAAARGDSDERVRSLAIRLAGPVPTTVRAESTQPRTAAPPSVDPMEAGSPPRPVEQVGPREGMSPRERFRQRRANRPDPITRMIPAGWATFGATYGVALVFAGVFMAFEPEIGGPALVPLIGTAIVAQNTWYECGDPGCVVLGMMSWLNSMFQITSFIIAMFGHRERRANDRRRASSTPRRGVTVAALPGESPGLSVSGWF